MYQHDFSIGLHMAKNMQEGIMIYIEILKIHSYILHQYIQQNI